MKYRLLDISWQVEQRLREVHLPQVESHYRATGARPGLVLLRVAQEVWDQCAHGDSLSAANAALLASRLIGCCCDPCEQWDQHVDPNKMLQAMRKMPHKQDPDRVGFANFARLLSSEECIRQLPRAVQLSLPQVTRMY